MFREFTIVSHTIIIMKHWDVNPYSAGTDSDFRNLCPQYSVRPTCTFVQSHQSDQLQVLILISLKNDNGQFQKWKVDYSI